MKENEVNAVIIDEVEDLIYVVDIGSFELLFMNRKTLEIMGLSDDSQWRGKRCYDVFHGRSTPCEDCPNSIIHKCGHYEWEKYNSRLNMQFYKKYKLISFDGKPAKLCVATDVTELRKASRELKRQLEIEKTLVSCVKTLNDTQNTEIAINKLLAIIADFHKAERAYIFEADSDGKYVKNTYEWCGTGIESHIDKLQSISVDVMQQWMKSFKKNDDFFVSSFDCEPDENSEAHKMLEKQGVEGFMTAPLEIDGVFTGYLGVDNPKENTDTFLLMQSVSSFVINDIQRRKNISKLYDLSYRDLLTGVGNRNAYVNFMKQLENQNLGVGIIFLDINGLKKVNDMYGHERGDKMICDVADVLKDTFISNIFRVGGDEFVVFCTNTLKDKFLCKADSLETLWKPGATASVGCLWIDDCSDIEEQVALADKLMYQNKHEYYIAKGEIEAAKNF
ncbi:MAG: diguanylate cyclase [Porcipelethomonas sp.]